MRARGACAILAVALSGCLALSGLDKEYEYAETSTDTAGSAGAAQGGQGGSGAGQAGQGQAGASQGGTGGAQAGQAGASQGGTGGGQAGQGAQAGASQGLGGASATCPPSSFSGLPTCQQSNVSECVACVCNDVNPKTLCAIAYKECLDDKACSETIECLLRACSVSACDPLAGSSAPKVQKLLPCLTDTCSTKCKPLLSSG